MRAHVSDDQLLEVADAPPIDGLGFRRPRGDDADYAAMAGVIGAANRHDEIPWLPTVANLREEIEDATGVDPGRDLVMAEVAGRAIAEAGVERVIRAGRPVYDVWGHVVPGYRRRGIGRALLRENLRRVAERIALDASGSEASDDRPQQVRAFADDAETGHRAILGAEGFASIRWFFRMRRPTLEDIPEIPLPAGIELRPVRPADHRTIIEAEFEAFRDHWEPPDLTEEVFETTFKKADLDTGLWVVAWDGDEVAGVVQNWIWHDENEELGVARGWLEHISVRRPWRRRGLGRAITAESLRLFRAAGMSEAMLGVDADNPTGALALYEGLGFVVERRSSVYGRSLNG